MAAVAAVASDHTRHVDAELTTALEQALGDGIAGARPVYGGDVAVSYRVELADGRRAVRQDPSPTPARLLHHRGGRPAVARPAARRGGARGASPWTTARTAHPPSSSSSWIETGDRRGASTEAELGRALAELHARRRAVVRPRGPAHHRQPGAAQRSLRRPGPSSTPSVGCCRSPVWPATRPALDPASIAALERLAGRLAAVGGPPEPPARLHGDLWAGNRLVGVDGRSWLIDPAAHGGHREFDLAMMRLFGGFGAACFTAYEETLPLAEGWEDRVALHQVAPLVVHAIKFGGGYRASATAAIARYA